MTRGDASGFFVPLQHVCTQEKEPLRHHDIVVVNKRHGKFEEVRNFGTAKTESEVSELYSKAQHWLNTNGGQQSIDFEDLIGRGWRRQSVSSIT